MYVVKPYNWCVCVCDDNQHNVMWFLCLYWLGHYNITCIIQSYKSTPLHIAAVNDHTEVMSLLIANGADVNMKDKVS